MVEVEVNDSIDPVSLVCIIHNIQEEAFQIVFILRMLSILRVSPVITLHRPITHIINRKVYNDFPKSFDSVPPLQCLLTDAEHMTISPCMYSSRSFTALRILLLSFFWDERITLICFVVLHNRVLLLHYAGTDVRGGELDKFPRHHQMLK